MNSDIVQLQSDVGDLQELLNGTQEHPENGLAPRVTALENTMGTFVAVPETYNSVGSAINYFNSTIDERLKWHELDNE